MADRSFLDWPFFDDRHRELAERLELWCQSNLGSIAHDDVDNACRSLVGKLAQGGWLRYVIPQAYGGVDADIDIRSLCLIRETLARYSALADFAFAMQGLGSRAITLAASEDIKRAYLPRVADGSAIAAFALTEERSGSDVAQLETTAADLGEAYRLTGAKTFISNGGIANFYTVFARTGEGPGARGISAFVVDANVPGVEIRERIRTIAPHPLATIGFRDAVVPKIRRIGGPGEGFKIAMATLDGFRATVGAAALGFARRALDEALARVTTRHIFGTTLSAMPVVQSDLAEMATEIDASALLIYRSAWATDTLKKRNSHQVAMAKMHATECAQRVIDRALQMHGGLGVVDGVPIEGLYREIRALRIYEGATEIQRIVIARQVLEEFQTGRNHAHPST